MDPMMPPISGGFENSRDAFTIYPASNGYIVVYMVPVVIDQGDDNKPKRTVFRKKRVVCKTIDEVIEQLSEFEMNFYFKTEK